MSESSLDDGSRAANGGSYAARGRGRSWRWQPCSAVQVVEQMHGTIVIMLKQGVLNSASKALGRTTSGNDLNEEWNGSRAHTQVGHLRTHVSNTASMRSNKVQ